MRLISPYTTAASTYRGQLHSHSSSLPSDDGTNTIAQMLAEFEAHGYDFVVSTPHEGNLSDPGGHSLLYIEGVEDGTNGNVAHFGCWPATTQSGPDTPQNVIDFHASLGRYVSVNHPSYPGILVAASSLVSYKNYTHIEVYNPLSGASAVTEDKWDAALSTGRHIWGTAVDDAHNVGDIGSGWVMVHADSLSQNAIMSSLASGNFYATQSPDISVMLTPGNTITASTSSAATIAFMNGGTLQSTAATTTGIYAVKGNERYVRVVVTRASDGLKAWAQPIFVETGERAMSYQPSGLYEVGHHVASGRVTDASAYAGNAGITIPAGSVGAVLHFPSAGSGWVTGTAKIQVRPVEGFLAGDWTNVPYDLNGTAWGSAGRATYAGGEVISLVHACPGGALRITSSAGTLSDSVPIYWF